MRLISFAGLPPTTVQGSTFFVTTAPAAMVEPFPTVTPPALASRHVTSYLTRGRKSMHAPGLHACAGVSSVTWTLLEGHCKSLSLTHDDCATANPAVVANGYCSCKFGAVQTVTPFWVQRVSWRIKLYHWPEQDLQQETTSPLRVFHMVLEHYIAHVGLQLGPPT